MEQMPKSSFSSTRECRPASTQECRIFDTNQGGLTGNGSNSASQSFRGGARIRGPACSSTSTSSSSSISTSSSSSDSDTSSSDADEGCPISSFHFHLAGLLLLLWVVGFFGFLLPFASKGTDHIDQATVSSQELENSDEYSRSEISNDIEKTGTDDVEKTGTDSNVNNNIGNSTTTSKKRVGQISLLGITGGAIAAVGGLLLGMHEPGPIDYTDDDLLNEKGMKVDSKYWEKLVPTSFSSHPTGPHGRNGFVYFGDKHDHQTTEGVNYHFAHYTTGYLQQLSWTYFSFERETSSGGYMTKSEAYIEIVFKQETISGHREFLYIRLRDPNDGQVIASYDLAQAVEGEQVVLTDSGSVADRRPSGTYTFARPTVLNKLVDYRSSFYSSNGSTLSEVLADETAFNQAEREESECEFRLFLAIFVLGLLTLLVALCFYLLAKMDTEE